jgi:thiol-disulfide isomerase/thioredoxin
LGYPSNGFAAPLDVGGTATDFTLMEVGTQNPVSLYDFEENIVLLDFFAYWCPHCVTAASELEPEIDQYYQQLGGNPDGIPVRLLAVSVANDDAVAVEDFITENGLTLALADEPLTVFWDYADGPIPHLAIINGASNTNYDQWEILYSDSGYGVGAYENLRTIIDSVDRVPVLQAGDANQDLSFNQLDLLQVLAARKYATGQPATWGEGDWDGAPGGSPGNPPGGNGVFDQRDVIAALSSRTFLTGPYAGIEESGDQDETFVAIGYEAATGQVWVNAPESIALTSVAIESAAGIFTADPAQNLDGDFDLDTDHTLFKAVFGTSFGTLRFGNVAQPGLSRQFLSDDLDVFGSLSRGGGLGEVDLVYVPVPEPSGLCLSAMGLFLLIAKALPTASRRSLFRLVL